MIDNKWHMEYSDLDMDKSGNLIETLIEWVNRVPAVALAFAESDYKGRIRTPPQPLVELLLVVGGSVQLSVGRRSARLAAGDCALINAHFGNWGEVGRRTDWHYDCVSFDIAGAQSMRGMSRKPLLEIRAMENPAAVHQLYREVAQLFHSPTSYLKKILLKAAVLRLLVALCASGTGPAVTSPTAGDRRLRSALTVLNERQADPALCVTDLAKAAALSPDHLGRLFRREFGMSPMPYLLHMRLNRARNLLMHTELIVKEVAFMTGFNDPLYFSRIFRKKFGGPPTETRK